jgi:hypothetical protein
MKDSLAFDGFTICNPDGIYNLQPVLRKKKNKIFHVFSTKKKLPGFEGNLPLNATAASNPAQTLWQSFGCARGSPVTMLRSFS